jgi:uncharacterized protein (TIGR03790 family)
LSLTKGPLYQKARKIPRWSLVFFFLFCFFLLWIVPAAQATLEPSQVLILVNKDTEISSQVAKMYQRLREIPSNNILSLSLGTNRQITPEQYWEHAAGPIKKYLEANPQIECILTTSGVPYTIQATDIKDDGSAFDNELAQVLREEPSNRQRRQPNPLYLYGMNSYGINDPRKLKMLYVVRLDGPDLKTITRMVEDAVAVEKAGLEGPVFGDARGLDGATEPAEADASIRAAIDRLSGAGFEATLDLKEETWTQPKGEVGNQAAGAAFYVGWYSFRNFQDIFGQQGLAKGAIAWHIASGEAADIWSPNEKGWCVNLMRRGAAVTLGPVREPYVDAFPRGDVFVERLLAGETIAESYWLALPHVSWEMVILGDPLYRPFGLKPKPSLVARAYIAVDANHVLEKSQTRALIVQLECVGPSGSQTPSLSAVAEPGIGLVAASGSINIPPLKAGQSTLVRVPSVTAGGDSTGMFRLHLNVQGDINTPRRIVLEGRVGFSRLTGGLLPQSQMFLSPEGVYLISGQPGTNTLVDTENLESQMIAVSKGFALARAEFSPDALHIAWELVAPQEKKYAAMITDNRFGSLEEVPFQFLRWLDSDKVLLRGPNGLTIHGISGGTKDEAVETPEGWSGVIIPRTNIQILASKEGKLAIKRGSEPMYEVLSGTSAIQFGAVANDLSLMGGVDKEKRLWVQRGLEAKPEIIANGVERVLWGPISRRALVQDLGGKSRIFDGRDRSWIDLGSVSGAVWSQNEQRMLFLQPEASTGFLSLLAGREIRQLCPTARIGPLAGAFISADGDKAFLLAGLSGSLEVWMMALPPRTASER